MALVTSVSIVAKAWVARKTFLAREAKYRRKGPASPDAGPIFIISSPVRHFYSCGADPLEVQFSCSKNG